MNLNLFVHFLTLYQIALIVKFVNAYVLFAANLEDFRSIAKKFVPEKLADQLVDMAAVKHKQKNSRDYDDIEVSEERERDALRDTKSYDHKPTAAKKNIDRHRAPDIDLDELVERVKERLADDYKKIFNQGNDKNLRNKQTTIRQISKTPIDNSQREINDNYKHSEDYELDDNETTPNVDYEDDTQRGPKYQTNTKTEAEYVDKNEKSKENKQEENTGQLFEQIDLLKSNDSYEDYDIPKKEDAFESVEPSIFKNEKKKRTEHSRVPKKKIPRNVVPYVDKWSPTSEYDDNGEIKARTESLLYEEAVNASASIDGVVRNKIKPKGTMIPTREYYKMSSPNYYAKLPLVAEKYNFDEPLPEKDREPESLKHIANPPASINRKIKLK